MYSIREVEVKLQTIIVYFRFYKIYTLIWDYNINLGKQYAVKSLFKDL